MKKQVDSTKFLASIGGAAVALAFGMARLRARPTELELELARRPHLTETDLRDQADRYAATYNLKHLAALTTEELAELRRRGADLRAFAGGAPTVMPVSGTGANAVAPVPAPSPAAPSAAALPTGLNLPDTAAAADAVDPGAPVEPPKPAVPRAAASVEVVPVEVAPGPKGTAPIKIDVIRERGPTLEQRLKSRAFTK